MVAVRLPSQLRKYAADTEVVAGDGDTVAEVLGALRDVHAVPRLIELVGDSKDPPLTMDRTLGVVERVERCHEGPEDLGLDPIEVESGH